jgi:hypothetical protein
VGLDDKLSLYKAITEVQDVNYAAVALKWRRLAIQGSMVYCAILTCMCTFTGMQLTAYSSSATIRHCKTLACSRYYMADLVWKTGTSTQVILQQHFVPSSPAVDRPAHNLHITSRSLTDCASNSCIVSTFLLRCAIIARTCHVTKPQLTHLTYCF